MGYIIYHHFRRKKCASFMEYFVLGNQLYKNELRNLVYPLPKNMFREAQTIGTHVLSLEVLTI